MIEDLDSLMEEAGIDTVIAEGSAFAVPDIYWLTGFRSPDSVIYFKNRGEDGVVAASYHTLDRISREGWVKKTLDLTELYRKFLKERKRPSKHPEIVYAKVLKDLAAGKTVGVPDHIPASVLIAVQQLGYEVKVVQDLFKDARATKSSREVKTIKAAGDATCAAIARVIEMIKDSEVKAKNQLFYDNSPLTVKRIKLALEHFLLDQMAESADDAIVAVGKKGFDWHYLGAPNDVLKAEVPIIIDVFPRLKLDRYVADVTRTVVKGSVSKKLQHMFDAVIDAGNAALDMMTDGVLIDDVNMACYSSLQDDGYDSTRLNPQAEEGMTHGLGHGIGLEVHENPSMYSDTARFAEGNVMAIEPGVYLKSIGGVRIENDYAVGKGKPKRLTLGLDNLQFV